jgi:hypothetical protein
LFPSCCSSFSHLFASADYQVACLPIHVFNDLFLKLESYGSTEPIFTYDIFEYFPCDNVFFYYRKKIHGHMLLPWLDSLWCFHQCLFLKVVLYIYIYNFYFYLSYLGCNYEVQLNLLYFTIRSYTLSISYLEPDLECKIWLQSSNGFKGLSPPKGKINNTCVCETKMKLYQFQMWLQ